MSTPSFQSSPDYHAAILATDLRDILRRLSSIRFVHEDAIRYLSRRAVEDLQAYEAFVAAGRTRGQEPDRQGHG